MSSSTDTIIDSAALTSASGSLLALLDQVIAKTTSSSSLSTTSDTLPINASTPPPLPLLSDATTLLRAQTTKLSLLLINKPFTPSAVRTMLVDIATKSLPAMMSAVQCCRVETQGRIMCWEVRMRVRRVFVELRALVASVDGVAAGGDGDWTPESHTRLPTATSNQKDQQKQKQPTNTKDAILSTTGVLFSSLDDLASLSTLGIPGLLVEKAEAYRALIEDATAELREWRDDAEDEGFVSAEDGDGFSDGVRGTNDEDGSGDGIEEATTRLRLDDGGASLDHLLSASHRLPSTRTDLKELLDRALLILKLTSALYAGVARYRFRTFPSSPTPSSSPVPVPASAPNTANGSTPADVQAQTRTRAEDLQRTDSTITTLRGIPETVDEMAETFYDLNADGVRDCLGRIERESVGVVDVLERGWVCPRAENEGKGKDGFGKWAENWRGAVAAVG